MKQLSLFSTTISEQEPQPCNPNAGTHWKLYVDGASRNNPGPSGAGIYIAKELVPIIKEGFFLGTKTNNQAEYYALLIGLYHLQKLVCPQDTVLIVSDSQLLIRQLQGIYKVKHPELKPLYTAAMAVIKTMNYDVMHVLREDNTIADKLANQGVDKKIKVPQEFFDWLQKYAA